MAWFLLDFYKSREHTEKCMAQELCRQKHCCRQAGRWQVSIRELSRVKVCQTHSRLDTLGQSLPFVVSSECIFHR